MGRKTLVNEIARLDSQLTARQLRIARSRRRVKKRLGEINPVYWLGGAAAVGYLLGRRDVAANVMLGRGAYHIAAGLVSGSAGSRLF